MDSSHLKVDLRGRMQFITALDSEHPNLIAALEKDPWTNFQAIYAGSGQTRLADIYPYSKMPPEVIKILEGVVRVVPPNFKVIKWDALCLHSDDSYSRLADSLRLWALTFNINGSDKWLFDAALRTLHEWFSDKAIDHKIYHSEPFPMPTFWGHPEFAMMTMPWNGEENWSIYLKRTLDLTRKGLEQHKAEVKICLGRRYPDSKKHALWTARRFAGWTCEAIANEAKLPPRPKGGSQREAVRSAVLNFSTRIGLLSLST